MTITEDRQAAPARVTRQELTYRKDGSASYVRDRLLRRKDPRAEERLKRHALEMDAFRRDEARKNTRSIVTELEDGSQIIYESRVNPSLTLGQGGELAPPLWVIQDLASFPRPNRILADIAPRFPLPAGCQSVSVPVLVCPLSPREMLLTWCASTLEMNWL